MADKNLVNYPNNKLMVYNQTRVLRLVRSKKQNCLKNILIILIIHMDLLLYPEVSANNMFQNL